jgi:hypothetical protein
MAEIGRTSTLIAIFSSWIVFWSNNQKGLEMSHGGDIRQ